MDISKAIIATTTRISIKVNAFLWENGLFLMPTLYHIFIKNPASKMFFIIKSARGLFSFSRYNILGEKMMKNIIYLIVLLLSSVSFAGTITVTDQDSFKAAVEQSATQSVTILIPNKISLDAFIFIPVSKNVVRILGTTDSSEISFTQRWNGDWTTGPVANNGITANSRQFLIKNISVSGWEWSGAALKFHSCESIIIDKVNFKNSVRIIYKSKKTPATTTADIWVSQVLNGIGEFVSLTECTFEDCATSDLVWNHCVYLSGSKSFIASGNKFIRCGSIWAMAPGSEDASINMWNNQILNPVAGPNRNGEIKFGVEFMGAANWFFCYNSYSGLLDHFWYGYMNENDFMDYNDFSGLKLISPTPIGQSGIAEHPWSWWVESGYDVHSKQPTTQPAP